jgi:hypothetical protein
LTWESFFSFNSGFPLPIHRIYFHASVACYVGRKLYGFELYLSLPVGNAFNKSERLASITWDRCYGFSIFFTQEKFAKNLRF